MRAAVVRTLPSLEPELADIDTPDPVPGELLLRVEACGICGTDLHILAGESYRPTLPFVLGHEGVGAVVAAGSPGDEHWIGRRVTTTLFEGAGGDCDLCRAGNGPCLSGNERLCPDDPVGHRHLPAQRSVRRLRRRPGLARDPGAGLARVPPGGRARGCGRNGGQHRRSCGARGHGSGRRRRRGPGRLLRGGASPA